jgi:hypothetical protein
MVKTMDTLKIGPLPKHETARVSITLSKPLFEALEIYASDFSQMYEKTDAPTLIPHMLDAFLRSDRAFMKRHADSIREQAAQAASPLPSATPRSPSA